MSRTYKSAQRGGGPKIDEIERTCFLNGPLGRKVAGTVKF